MDNQADVTPSNSNLPRRKFVGAGTAALAGLGLSSLSANAAPASSVSSLFEVPMNSKGEYELPPLNYAYDALEPHIDKETMHLHHDIHFNGYKKGLNAALAKLAEFRAAGDYPQIAYWENSLAFNGAGYNLHVVFFDGMAPAGTTKPSKALTKEIESEFGSMDGFKGQMTNASKTVQGSGWGILGWQPMGGKLVILQAEKHQNLSQWNVIPILALDVWEHAYYLKYQNKRGDYIDNWWDVVNWDYAEKRLAAAKTIV